MAIDSEILQPRTAAESVAAQLRSAIQRGELTPGEPLRQNEVARRLGVSTTPVREAFAMLQADGLVQIDRYRGAVVFRPTPEDVRDAYEIREALESLAIAKAAPLLNEERYEELGALLAEMRRTKDLERWIELNDLFHLGIYKTASSPRLLAVIASQRDACAQYIRLDIEAPARRALKDQQHQEILDACRAHDIKGAQRALRRHLRDSVQEMLDLIKETEPAADAAVARPSG
jgi:DNA-binding GntR family transcriptional regulator